MKRACLDCGVLFEGLTEGRGSRCSTCAGVKRSIYRGDWPAESRTLRAAQPWCHAASHAPGCRVYADLTVDHPTRLVLSRSCHNALEHQRRRSAA